MHPLRKLTVLGLAALALTGAVASSSAALVAQNASTSVDLAVGSRVNGHAASVPTTLTLVFSGTTTRLSCTTSAFTATVHVNGPTAVALQIDTLTFSGCTNEATGGTCSVTASGLPWTPTAAPAGDTAGLLATSTSAMSLGTGPSTGNWIQASNSLGNQCLPLGATCHFSGGTAGPLSSGGATVTNYATGTWSNAVSEFELSAAPISWGVCGAGTWSGRYQVRTGEIITGGNTIRLV